MSSLILAGMLGGLGKGAADFGSMMYQLEEKKQARLDELRERAELLGLGGGLGGGLGRARGAASAKPTKGESDIEMWNDVKGSLGWSNELPKKEDYTKDVERQTGGSDFSATEKVDRGDDGEDYSDAISRKLAKVSRVVEKAFDKETFDRDTARVISRNMEALIKFKNPSAWDDVAKGDAQGIINRALEAAERAESPSAKKALIESATKLSIAMKGGKQYDVDGNVVLDTSTGKNDPTKVGESMMAKNNKQGDAATKRAENAGGGRASVDRTDDQILRDMDQERKRINDLNKRYENASKEDKPKILRMIEDAEDRYASLRSERDARRRTAANAAPPPASSPPPANRPPLSSFMRN